jgi:hypothetical protein
MSEKVLGYGVVLFALLGLFLALPGFVFAIPCWWIALALADAMGDRPWR